STITAEVMPGGAVYAAGNPNDDSNQLSVVYDAQAPTVTVTAPTGPTNSASLVFGIVFSESVNNLIASEITVTNGTAASLTGSGITITNGAPGTLTGSGTTYTLDVTPSVTGTVTVTVNAAAATDTAGNDNLDSNTYSVLYDGTAPACTVSGPSSPSNDSPMIF